MSEVQTPEVQHGALHPGDRVEQYEITGLLGEGGMGTVYEGVQPVIGKRVAVKVLRRELAAHPGMVDRFIQEARAANAARSRYIIDIFGFGRLPDGSHYFVMEYLDGKPLAELLRAKRPLSFSQRIAIVEGVCRGLQVAHDQGIVHRDLKPDNIYVLEEEEESRPQVKILDFGIAKFTDGSVKLTHGGLVMGTPAYMSPEQITGQELDLRSDLYALGVIMFEVFAGRPPFEGTTPMAVANLHVNQPPPDPRSLHPELPLELSRLMLRCLAKDRAARPASAREVWQALQRVAASDPSQVELARTTPVGVAPRPQASAPSPSAELPPAPAPSAPAAAPAPQVTEPPLPSGPPATSGPAPTVQVRSRPWLWALPLGLAIAAGGYLLLAPPRDRDAALDRGGARRQVAASPPDAGQPGLDAISPATSPAAAGPDAGAAPRAARARPGRAKRSARSPRPDQGPAVVTEPTPPDPPPPQVAPEPAPKTAPPKVAGPTPGPTPPPAVKPPPASPAKKPAPPTPKPAAPKKREDDVPHSF
jgi:serine/threonine-protein kinase